ncbi:PrgI family protein [Candidatus Gottesmanbacteria bacterium]|nr:PrgI family protein [Candidatus Gottesmanbacteria bacterium]
MEQHPVPQNVTTFQFRLIGDWTIKQFGYLAGGAIAAYVCFKLPLPFFFRWPLAVGLPVFGFGLAFVPIEERPMDVWILSFFKSIYSPTEYLWSRSAGQKPASRPVPPPASSPRPFFSHAPAPAQAMPTIAAPQPATITPRILTYRPTDVFAWLKDWLKSRPKAPPSAASDVFRPETTPSVTGKRLDISTPPTVAVGPAPAADQAIASATAKTAALQEKLNTLTAELTSKTVTESRILELQKQLSVALSQKNTMEQDLMRLRQQINRQPPATTPLRQATMATPVAVSQPTVRIISPEAAVRAGLPRLTTFPNVVTGIIKDPNRELLSGVLVTVRDKEGIPLRALKTNRVGQFAASTPLPNGTYVVEVEDPRARFVFDRAQITVTGALLPPLEITAKGQKELTREKLTKEIFGNQI